MTDLHAMLQRNGIDDAAALDRVRAELADRAQAASLMDVAYRTFGSPVGTLLLAATPDGLVRLAYEIEGHDAVLASLADRISPRVLHAPGRLDDAARELDEYFAGARRRFDVPLDLRLRAGFRRAVLDQLRSGVGYGQTVSYSALAGDVGNARAVRAVASACATNPLPLFVPCHRVIRRDGSSGDYIGGVVAKRTLLRLESRR
jgi:methylated-DNA-[protein]-cysteine S-methyltransferase